LTEFVNPRLVCFFPGSLQGIELVDSAGQVKKEVTAVASHANQAFLHNAIVESQLLEHESLILISNMWLQTAIDG
jgi:hypothetical protein